MRIFTDEQYKELKDYGKQIEEFIRNEICSKIQTQIVLPVGTETTKLGNPKFRLIVDKNNIHGYSGNLGICFKEEDRSDESGRDVYIYDSWNYGAEYLYQLCLNWKDGTNIKQALMNVVEKQKVESGKVFNKFTV
ncbi:MAG: hypothetical protein IJA34_00585 [Lachnospiraceae bacterium]|nr:hypothetical protein [Lachnospiraceae bacterium]